MPKTLKLLIFFVCISSVIAAINETVTSSGEDWFDNVSTKKTTNGGVNLTSQGLTTVPSAVNASRLVNISVSASNVSKEENISLKAQPSLTPFAASANLSTAASSPSAVSNISTGNPTGTQPPSSREPVANSSPLIAITPTASNNLPVKPSVPSSESVTPEGGEGAKLSTAAVSVSASNASRSATKETVEGDVTTPSQGLVGSGDSSTEMWKKLDIQEPEVKTPSTSSGDLPGNAVDPSNDFSREKEAFDREKEQEISDADQVGRPPQPPNDRWPSNSGDNDEMVRPPSRQHYEEMPPAEDTHFFTYLIVSIGLIVCSYLAFHNRKRLFAMLLEGRQSNRTKGRKYRSLNTADEVESSRHMIY